MHARVTADRVRELLSYDPETGEFRHRQKRKGVRFGSLAGTISGTDGLRYIGVDGRKYAAQRLAWLYTKGEWPDVEVGFVDPSLASPLRERENNLSVMIVKDLNAEELRRLFFYDPDTGIFTNRASRKGNTAGKEAGSVDSDGYRYLGVRGDFHAAQRLAWLYVYGEWPDGNVRFKSGDKTDCRIDNLYIPDVVSRVPALRREHDRADRVARPDRYRDKDLQRNFGISLADYQCMLVEQKGVCAICEQPETSVRNGRIKMLAVDHNHGTSAIRSLLCSNCNPMIGYAKDDPARLRAAADYLERWAEKHANIVPLRKDAS